MVYALGMCLAHGTPLEDFIADAERNHGEVGARAARFLVENMPASDKESLTAEFLFENLDLAFRVREEFSWAVDVPEEIFLNDVLPYAVFDETRDPWRAELYRTGGELVSAATTASEAAQILNRELFNVINVHYNTGRKRPNQSLKESKQLQMATCTGLSIILVEACRAVGIPARAVGTPLWSNGRGNHTWVEIWDGEWHFTGADEYDADGLDRGWFVADAAEAQEDIRRHAIFATSWKREGVTFPMVWAWNSEAVAAVNVTTRYARLEASEDLEVAKLGVRLWNQSGGSRLSAKVCVFDGRRRECGIAETKSGTADLNDMPRFNLEPGSSGWLRFTLDGEIRELRFGTLKEGVSTIDAVWEDLPLMTPSLEALQKWLSVPHEQRDLDSPILTRPLTRQEAETASRWVAQEAFERLKFERKEEFEAKVILLEGKQLRWMERIFGEETGGGRSLWISMHGGGNTRAEVNDRQWNNQIDLYEPIEGIYVAPRAPTDTWNLWHESHIDPMFQRLIEDYVLFRNVDPDKVYLLGYSAGGDGVWQLAPRMADRFAAAAMMAGHPNEASLLGLRNLPFGIFMGAEDSAYNRNKVATERASELQVLSESDPGGYVHMARIYEGQGHWMNRKDAEALPWMAGFERDAWPSRIVWQQDDVVHRRFYWLELPEGVEAGERRLITAHVTEQSIEIEGDLPERLRLRLSDRLTNLDHELRVMANGNELFRGRVDRTALAIIASLKQRADVPSTATALLDIQP